MQPHRLALADQHGRATVAVRDGEIGGTSAGVRGVKRSDVSSSGPVTRRSITSDSGASAARSSTPPRTSCESEYSHAVPGADRGAQAGEAAQVLGERQAGLLEADGDARAAWYGPSRGSRKPKPSPLVWVRSWRNRDRRRGVAEARREVGQPARDRRVEVEGAARASATARRRWRSAWSRTRAGVACPRASGGWPRDRPARRRGCRRARRGGRRARSRRRRAARRPLGRGRGRGGWRGRGPRRARLRERRRGRWRS